MAEPGRFAAAEGAGPVAPVLQAGAAARHDRSVGIRQDQAGTAVAVIAVSCDEERATTLCVVLNPAKLRGWHRR
ncbi:hypothetical protein GCM10009827_087220 [Dactylosporangium maewongense]|uniref:Uncharacterized protein n=1 Tax=Dactylosporangium maewongense TaxID=634393 RepID=A0ABN2C876_9ACTN